MKIVDPITGVKKQVTFTKDHKPVFTIIQGGFDNERKDVPVEEEKVSSKLETPSDVMYWEAWYPELPDMRFTTVDGIGVFNASEFARKRGYEKDKDLKKFFSNTPCIAVYAKKLGTDKLIRFSEAGDVLLNEVLAFSFVEYVDPSFSIYMHDRMHELFYNGVVVSDNYLAVAAKRRLPRKVLEKLIKQ
ncbi:hypothetical protein [Parabacteroides sp.]